MKADELSTLLRNAIPQVVFADLVGLSEARVSQLVSDGLLERGHSGGAWLRAYCGHLREVAAGRASSELGGLDLVQERAALARAQRLGHDIKNEIARKTYAPISLLAETLAMASQAVVERFEQLPSALKKACPELPEAARDQVMTVIAAARNEWVERTMAVVTHAAADLDVGEDDMATEPP